MTTKTTVVYHRADYDGLFCREIARKFLPDATFIGWDYGDPPLPVPEGKVYIFDLPCDTPFGVKFQPGALDAFAETSPNSKIREQFNNWVWIDHHKTAIETHPIDLPGYRIEGVAACRLVWQWFTHWKQERDEVIQLPVKSAYVDRLVDEPLAVRLAGEYDVWDHRSGDDIAFQFGLDSLPSIDWPLLFGTGVESRNYTGDLISNGKMIRRCQQKRDARVVVDRSFIQEFEGLKFLALNTAKCYGETFAIRDHPGTGHSALMGFYFDGKAWNFSLYQAEHRKDLDLSRIALKYGGGGHAGACGFRVSALPFSCGLQNEA